MRTSQQWLEIGRAKVFALKDGWIKVKRDDIIRPQYSFSSPPKSPRLLIGLNQPLIILNEKKYLVDTGLGDRWTAEELGLIDFQKPRAMIRKLNEIGLHPEDIDVVIFTHLHYDHCGGILNTEGDNLANIFTKSIFYIQREEWEFALNPPLNRRSDYRPEVLEVLKSDPRLELVEGEVELDDGLRIVPLPGHTPGHQGVILEQGSQRLLILGDLLATIFHANITTTMTYDNNPKEVLHMRKEILTNPVNYGTFLFLAHSYHLTFGRLTGAKKNGNFDIQLIEESPIK
ncbi:MAG: MBL fold metallo-hydrolase [bacterium]